MRPNDFEDSRDLLDREANFLENRRRFLDRISNIIPFRQRDGVFRTMTNKDPQVMHPRRGKKNVFIERLISRKAFGQCEQTDLMRIFVRRLRLRADVFDDFFPVSHPGRISASLSHWKAAQRNLSPTGKLFEILRSMSLNFDGHEPFTPFLVTLWGLEALQALQGLVYREGSCYATRYKALHGCYSTRDQRQRSGRRETEDRPKSF